MLPFENFRNYTQSIVYGLHNALGSDGSYMLYGGPYLMALNIQDPFTNIEYDYVKNIIEKMQE